MVATVAAGCGGSGGGGGSAKVGAPVAPVTLRLADANRGTATPGVLDFVRDVKQLSHGAVTIEIVTAPNKSLDYEGDIVRATASGRWDLAWVGGRTLDSVGVPSAGALQVPFLIDNYATQSKVLLGPIGRQLTHDMSKAGVTGLALIPDHLSYLVTTAPIDSPDDLAGRRMRAFGRSRSQAAAFRALGATPVPLNGTTDRAAGEMKKHHLFGIESNPLLWSDSRTPAPPTRWARQSGRGPRRSSPRPTASPGCRTRHSGFCAPPPRAPHTKSTGRSRARTRVPSGGSAGSAAASQSSTGGQRDAMIRAGVAAMDNLARRHRAAGSGRQDRRAEGRRRPPGTAARAGRLRAGRKRPPRQRSRPTRSRSRRCATRSGPARSTDPASTTTS